MALHSEKILQDLSNFMLEKYCRYSSPVGKPLPCSFLPALIPSPGGGCAQMLTGCVICLGIALEGSCASFLTDAQIAVDLGVKNKVSASFCYRTEVGFGA